MKPVKILQTSIEGSIVHGHQSVGTTAVKLSPVSVLVKTGVLIRTPGTDDPIANANTVWVGSDKITGDSDIQTGGFPLPPGSSIVLDVDDVSKVWCVAEAASHDVAWIGVQ
jgi:hypothetical protein